MDRTTLLLGLGLAFPGLAAVQAINRGDWETGAFALAIAGIFGVLLILKLRRR